MSLINLAALLVAFVTIANAHSVHWMKMVPADHIDGPLKEDHYRGTFEQFKLDHGKSYESTEEEERRFQVFMKNIKTIEEHNESYRQGKKSFSLGINQFTDMEIDEYIQYNKLQKREPQSHGSTYLDASNVVLPGSIDWREKGYVTGVKNQGQCGSCWSFSTTGSLEGQHFKKSGTLLSLSEQQLVDCSTSFGNHGCDGGLMDQAFKYIEVNGIELETEYPYTAKDGNCKYDKSQVVANCTGFIDVTHGDESALQKSTATIGPISIAIDASHSSFQMYSSGVYDEPNCSSTALDHGVLIVGYGTDQGKDYWLVKNSWGDKWGQNGYIWMSRNKDNQCGVASQASYPLV